MNKRAIVYYEGEQTDDRLKQIEHCRQSWIRYGWDFVLQSWEDVPKTIESLHFLERCKKFPRGNDWHIYEKNCYAKWLAARAIGGGLITEWDVINYGLEPFEPEHDLERWGQFYFGLTYAYGHGLETMINEIAFNGDKYAAKVPEREFEIVGDHLITTSFEKVFVREDIQHLMPWDLYDHYKEGAWKRTEVVPNLSKPYVVHYNNGWYLGIKGGGKSQEDLSRADAIIRFEKEYLNL
jgi:hypothetical protein